MVRYVIRVSETPEYIAAYKKAAEKKGFYAIESPCFYIVPGLAYDKRIEGGDQGFCQGFLTIAECKEEFKTWLSNTEGTCENRYYFEMLQVTTHEKLLGDALKLA